METGSEQDLPRAREESRDAPQFVPDPTPATTSAGPSLSPGVVTVGVQRPEQPGTRGVAFTVTTNHFAIDFSDNLIYHYDVTIVKDGPEPASMMMPTKWNQELIRILQEKIVPTVFTPRAVYDGRKNLFSSRLLPLRGRNKVSQTFNVTLRPPYERPPPQVYEVTVCLVGSINPALLKQYCLGQHSVDNEVLKCFAPLNIILRMKPSMSFPSNTRSLFTDQELLPIGAGIELWRGYFQSIRPGIRSLLVKVDTHTGTMFAPGPMIKICQQIIYNQSPSALIPGGGLGDRDRLKLQRFLSSVRFLTIDTTGRGGRKPKVLKKITAQGADSLRFTSKDGLEMTVSEYFVSLGITLHHPKFVCVETASGAAYPIELCYIIPGQPFRKQVPPELADASGAFMRKSPEENLNSIAAGHSILSHNTSEYMRPFGMTVDPTPQKCLARMLKAPLLDYGQNVTHRPENGAWNFKDRKVYEPAEVQSWAVVVYDTRAFNMTTVREAIGDLVAQAARMGIHMDDNPPISFAPAQFLDVAQHLQSAGAQAYQKHRIPPRLLVVILPQNSAELYQAIKHFGDITRGVATQCLKADLVRIAKEQYWANVCLKINAKLGGVNAKLNEFDNPSWVFDPDHPVMVIASRVMHPAPGAYGRPSFSGVVGSLDSNIIRYSAVSLAQDSRVRLIHDLEGMIYELISRHVWWKANREKQTKTFPERIIYYHSGVPDASSQVLSVELPAIQVACKRHRINPKITIINVGKRHHVRFFPIHGMADSTGNCPAGTVVDSVVGNPQEFDFYLQSHSTPMGTAHPLHYSVIFDQNDFSQDGVQELTYALCQTSARTTRSLSVPAPLYYADVVSERAKNHYDPSISYNNIGDEEYIDGEDAVIPGIQRYRNLFKPTHEAMRYTMYFQ